MEWNLQYFPFFSMKRFQFLMNYSNNKIPLPLFEFVENAQDFLQYFHSTVQEVNGLSQVLQSHRVEIFEQICQVISIGPCPPTDVLFWRWSSLFPFHPLLFSI